MKHNMFFLFSLIAQREKNVLEGLGAVEGPV